MSTEFFEELFANRIGGKNFGKGNDIFKFEKIKRAKKEAMERFPNMELIDLGVGEPEFGASKEIVDILSIEAKSLRNRKYADNGIDEFKEAAINYLEKVYKVYGLNYEKNVVHGIGSKSILAMLPLCLINSGDIALVTVPGYPILGSSTRYLGGEVYELPLYEKNGYLPDLDNIPEDILKKAKVLYINYPNNPTGAVATREFYKSVVDFAKKNNILVVQDAAYASINFDNEPLSFLSVEGAIDVGVEIHSLSKAFNMTGWRLAFIVGHEKIIDAFKMVKDNNDSGQFRAIQKAGVYALNHPEITKNNCIEYSKRMDLLVDALREVGFEAKKPKGSFYIYVKSPKGAGDTIFKNAEEACEYLLVNALISTVPWDEVGSYLRFSVTFESYERGAESIINELKARLLKLKLFF